MKKEFSIYLDLVRFLAAMLVVAAHFNLNTLLVGTVPFSEHGHQAVMIFFVLSGYVISYIAASRERDPRDYWASRLSRFYSIAIPALLLSPLLDIAGQAMAPHFYAGKTTNDFWWLRILASLAFVNEFWGLSIMTFSNVPYWSLCYEIWYYALFAMATFLSGKRRLYWVACAALLLGPKIMVLAPVWVLGVLLHRWRRLEQLREPWYWALFFASIVAYTLFQHYKLTELGGLWLKALIGERGFHEAAYSRYFITDYLLALVIAANFVGFRGIAHRFSALLLTCERPIRWVASFTFSLYLLHQPVLLFYAALINGDKRQPWFILSVAVLTFVTVFAIGTVTEHKRGYMRRVIRVQLVRLTESRWWARSMGAGPALPARPQP